MTINAVDFKDVSTAGLESSPVADALAGLRANESRYFKNKYDHDFVTYPAEDATDVVNRVHQILVEERDIVIESTPLEATEFVVDGTRWSFVFYESGLAINVMYALEDGGKRAVGFKLSEGMDVPEELADRFKFARQKSKLAGTIRGTFFVIKGAYRGPRSDFEHHGEVAAGGVGQTPEHPDDDRDRQQPTELRPLAGVASHRGEVRRAAERREGGHLHNHDAELQHRPTVARPVQDRERVETGAESEHHPDDGEAHGPRAQHAGRHEPDEQAAQRHGHHRGEVDLGLGAALQDGEDLPGE